MKSYQHLARPPSWRTPLVGCLRQLLEYICINPPYRKPILHPEPEDALCRGDRDWIHPAQARDRWRGLVNALIKFRVP
jgi:hypothetical protein